MGIFSFHLAHVPVTNGQVQETGDFELDGVTFPAAEIVLEFLDPSEKLLPGDFLCRFDKGDVIRSRFGCLPQLGDEWHQGFVRIIGRAQPQHPVFVF